MGGLHNSLSQRAADQTAQISSTKDESTLASSLLRDEGSKCSDPELLENCRQKAALALCTQLLAPFLSCSASLEMDHTRIDALVPNEDSPDLVRGG